jgi:hypothetical protein
VRRWLILVSIAFLVVLLLATTLLSARYVMSGASVFQLATLLNQLGRPLVALIFAAVLVARFRDIWSRRVDVDEAVSSGIARVAQVTGIVLMVFFYIILLLVIYFQLVVPTRQRAELPIFFIFGPLLTALPVGYFLFELGRLIDKDRRGASA